MKPTIFVVDDEEDIRDILKVNLESAGYAVNRHPSAQEAWRALERHIPDLILLDIMMPGMDGYEFCRRLRSTPAYSAIPVIFLSAKSEELDTVLGLELGADDYVAKPFSIKEVLSRVKAVLRRASRQTESRQGAAPIIYKGIEFSPDRFELRVDGEDVKLTKTEFEILYLFLKNPGKIFSRDNIINSIRGLEVYVVDRTIDVHIMNLRKKLGPYKNVITTFSGVGYGFKE